MMMMMMMMMMMKLLKDIVDAAFLGILYSDYWTV